MRRDMGVEMRPNWANRTIWTGDNLEIMRGMNSESVDLIYLDPPFNSNADYAAPVGSKAAGAAFKDTWSLDDVDVEWINLIASNHPALHRVLLAAMSDSDKSYLAYMSIRMLEMHRILKPTGSIYLHCDATMEHYLKTMMDSIFGKRGFKNEIAWCYTGPSNTKRYFPRKFDKILFYARGSEWTFNWDDIRIPYKKLKTGNTSGIFDQAADLDPKGKVPDNWWPDITPVGRLAKERLGYPTQKPLRLLHRIIRASSNADDVVLDPFCGCATTCFAAHDLGRRWAGIDISPKAAELARFRMRRELGELYSGTRRTDIPKRTDLGELPPPKSHESTLYGRQKGHCAGCGEHFKERRLHIDHIIARGKGGTDHVENLQLLCGRCNSVKGDRGMDYLRAKLQLAGISN